MRGPSDAIYPPVTLRGCDRLCHRSAAAQRLCWQGWDLWVNLGAARCPSALTVTVVAVGEGWMGWGGVRWGWSCGSWWIFAGRYSEQSEPRQTNPDGDSGAPMREMKEKMKEGNRQMYRQTKWRWRWPRVSSRRAAITSTQSSIVVILLPPSWVPSTNFGPFYADRPITRRLAKSWPRRLGESHGCCGISLLRLSQHEWGWCWLRLANDSGVVTIKHNNNIRQTAISTMCALYNHVMPQCCCGFPGLHSALGGCLQYVEWNLNRKCELSTVCRVPHERGHMGLHWIFLTLEQCMYTMGWIHQPTVLWIWLASVIVFRCSYTFP